MSFVDTASKYDPSFKMLWSFLHPEEGYEAGADEQKKAWEEGRGELEPYNQNGMNQIGKLNNAEDQLLNPEELQNKWAQGYEKSPYAVQMQKEAAAGGMDAASAQGLLGSSAALQNVQTSSANIMNADRQQYLKDLMEKYTTGLNLGNSMYGVGAQAGNSLMQGRLKTGENLSEMAYGAKNSPGSLFERILGTAVGAYTGKGGK